MPKLQQKEISDIVIFLFGHFGLYDSRYINRLKGLLCNAEAHWAAVNSKSSYDPDEAGNLLLHEQRLPLV